MAVHKSAKASENPAYPDAHATAPGGMSMAALRAELITRHGYNEDSTANVKWPDLIQMVINARLIEERKTEETAVELLDVLTPLIEDIAAEEEEDMFDDLDDLFEDDEPPNQHTTSAAREQTEIEGDIIEDEILFDPEVLFAEMTQAREEDLSANPPIFMGIPGIKDYVFDGHAGAGPSGSERWMHCTMSLSASREFLETLSPNQQRAYAGANTAARQGTTAHSLGEAQANLMLGRIEQSEFDATVLALTLEPAEEAEAYTEEMAEYVTEYIDLISTYAAERGADHILIESAVGAAIPLSGNHTGEVYVVRGKGDAVVLPTPEDPNLVVIDLKYGEGIFVDVEENSQEMIYALGVLDMLTDDDGVLMSDVETVTLYIAQPRMGGLREWTISLDDLYDWRDDALSPALTAALYGAAEGATFNPGKTQCQFCPARGRCPALAEQRIEQAAELFDTILEGEFEGTGFPETTSLSNERLASLLTQITGLTSLQTDLKDELQRRLHRGTTVPGYHLVNYTPPRKWKDGAEDRLSTVKGISAAQRKALFKPPTMITPTQAEKILADDYAKITALVEKPDKRPVAAPESDRRSKWEGKAPEDMFPDLDDESGDK